MARTTRRQLLAGLGCSAIGTAGCLDGRNPISILAAGSLQSALEGEFTSSVDIPVAVEAHGSVRAARMVANGHRDPDLLALADVDLFDAVVGEPWHAIFATNAIVLAYSPNSDHTHHLANATPWFAPLTQSEVRLGRTDPDLDPLGYRTLFTLDLAGQRAGRPELPETVLAPNQIYPETQLLAALESGQLDAAFVYRNMAVAHGVPFRELSPAVNLSDPARSYDAEEYTLPDGTTVSPEPIQYGAVCRSSGDKRTIQVFDRLVASAMTTLDETGLTIPSALPTYVGSVPNSLR